MKAKILIVDDDPEMLKLYGYALHRAGHTPIAASDAEEALRKLRAEEPDLVILDIMLPDVDGFEICRQLRAHQATEALPIIMLTARGGVDDTIEGLQAGADEYLSKPVTAREMVARVEALLGRMERLRVSTGPRVGRVWGFIGAKGGMGTTTLVLNVGALLAEDELNVVAAELRTSSGSFDDMLAHAPKETLGDLLARDIFAADEHTLRRYLLADAVGLQVLHGPQDSSLERTLTADQARDLVDGLAGFHEYVLLDLPSTPTAATQAALLMCEWVVLVLKAEPASLRAAVQRVATLKNWGIGAGIVRPVLVHQAPLAAGMSVDDMGQELGIPIFAAIPPAPDAFVVAQRQGRPLALIQPQNPAAQAMRRLANSLLEAA